MSIDINVYLRKKGGGRTRAQGLLSAKETLLEKKTNKMGMMATFMGGGKPAQSALMGLPIMREIMIAGKIANKAFNFGVNVSQAHSGEEMYSHNMKAVSKLVTTLGTSMIFDSVNHVLYRRPQIARENNMLQYGRDLYLKNIEGEKNKFG